MLLLSCPPIQPGDQLKKNSVAKITQNSKLKTKKLNPSKRRLNTGMAAVECNCPSSRRKQLPSSAKRLKTSESSSENLKLGENPGDGETAQVRREKKFAATRKMSQKINREDIVDVTYCH